MIKHWEHLIGARAAKHSVSTHVQATISYGPSYPGDPSIPSFGKVLFTTGACRDIAPQVQSFITVRSHGIRYRLRKT